MPNKLRLFLAGVEPPQRKFDSIQVLKSTEPTTQQGEHTYAGGNRARHPGTFRIDLLEELFDRSGAFVTIERQGGFQCLPLFAGQRSAFEGQPSIPRLVRLTATEGMPSGQHLVDDTGQGVDVIPRVRLAVLEHFGTGIGGGQRAE